MAPSAMAETRVSITGLDDIEKLKPAILAAFDHEVMKHQSKDYGQPSGITPAVPKES